MSRGINVDGSVSAVKYFVDCGNPKNVHVAASQKSSCCNIIRFVNVIRFHSTEQQDFDYVWDLRWFCYSDS